MKENNDDKSLQVVMTILSYAFNRYKKEENQLIDNKGLDLRKNASVNGRDDKNWKAYDV